MSIKAITGDIGNSSDGIFIIGMLLFFKDTLSAWAGGTDLLTYIILGLTVRLAKGDPDKISAYVDELKAKRTTSQPLDVPSAGSTFKRPEGYFAGKLIEDSGLRGFKLDESGAQVSPKHCGFVVNNGGTASAADVMRLIRYVQQTVLDKQGVKIEPEVRLIGKF